MKPFLFILHISFFASSYAQYPFKIKGNTADFLNGQKIYLVVEDRYSDKRYKFRDSIFIKNNSFYFSGTINKLSENAQLYTKQVRGFFDFVVDTGNNEIKIYSLKPKTPFYKNKLSNSEVINSRSNKIKKKIDSLINYSYLRKGKPSASNKNIIELSNSDKAELINTELSIIKQNPEIFYSLVHLYSMSKLYLSLNTGKLSETFNSLNEEIRNSSLGVEFNEKIQVKKSVEIGSMAKTFTANTNYGSVFSNAEMIGRPYLLAFGATWCVPCKENLPALKKLYQKHRSEGLEIVYVNLDEMTEKWKSQVIKYDLKWVNVSESVKWPDSKISKLFNVTALPFYLVIDKTGKIVYNQFQLKDESLKEIEAYIIRALR